MKTRKTDLGAPFFAAMAIVMSTALPACGGRFASESDPLNETPTCPATTPADGEACTSSLVCSYAQSCNDASATCSGGAWHVVQSETACAPTPLPLPTPTPTPVPVPTPTPACPATVPVDGGSCATGLECSYPEVICGFSVSVDASCRAGVWQISEPAVGCDPLPTPCPVAVPQMGASCTGGMVCQYGSLACGSVSSVATCTSGAWGVSEIATNCDPLPGGQQGN